MQPPRSTNFYPVDFHLWGHLKRLVYSTSVENGGTLHQCVFDAWQTIRNRSGTLERTKDSVIRRVHKCMIQLEVVLSICCEMSLDKY